MPLYSGKPPELKEGDVFQTIIPLDDEYSFDAQIGKTQQKGSSFGKDFGKDFGNNFGINETQKKIIVLITENAEVTTDYMAEEIGISRRQIEVNISKLKSLKLITREGGRKSGRWIVNINDGV